MTVGMKRSPSTIGAAEWLDAIAQELAYPVARARVLDALRAEQWSRERAAARLGLSLRGLYRLLETLALGEEARAEARRQGARDWSPGHKAK